MRKNNSVDPGLGNDVLQFFIFHLVEFMIFFEQNYEWFIRQLTKSVFVTPTYFSLALYVSIIFIVQFSCGFAIWYHVIRVSFIYM